MRLSLKSLVFPILSVALLATEQIEDSIIVKNSKFEILAIEINKTRGYDSPLESPDFPVRKVLPKFYESNDFVISSNCWRGYTASWSVVDGKLYLTAIDSYVFRKENGELFAKRDQDLVVKTTQKGSRPVYPKGRFEKVDIKKHLDFSMCKQGIFADWFSGIIFYGHDRKAKILTFKRGVLCAN